MTVVSVETLEKLKQIRLRRMTCVFYSLLRVSILSFSNMCKLGLRINDDNIHWACNLIKEKVCFMISSLCLCNIFKWKCVSITMLWVLLDTSICSLIYIYIYINIHRVYVYKVLIKINLRTATVLLFGSSLYSIYMYNVSII